ncbi:MULTISPECIES: hypothetical protein [Heyndrickxia]|uniref:hypothetical protein n=1 Tax=Heyndrickxia TaxID=2837504 RepID=UPI00115F3963|nr:hypothetical protein [Heyndrickxia coagulans]MED4963215.1 hypothetical protein [Heyndrickxia coagulans]
MKNEKTRRSIFQSKRAEAGKNENGIPFLAADKKFAKNIGKRGNFCYNKDVWESFQPFDMFSYNNKKTDGKTRTRGGTFYANWRAKRN